MQVRAGTVSSKFRDYCRAPRVLRTSRGRGLPVPTGGSGRTGSSATGWALFDPLNSRIAGQITPSIRAAKQLDYHATGEMGA